MNQVTIIVTLWTLARFQFQVSGLECDKNANPTNIAEDQLPLFRYSIIVDAGSSGSRIHVYKWQKQETVALPKFEHICSWRTSPGVSSCKTNPEIKEHLSKLLDAAKPYVPVKLISTSPIYFLATAGMRMLLEDRANSATEYIRELLSNPSFSPFQHQSPDNTRILSGEEEGIFAWIAANYITNVFTAPDPKSQTRGILELGGASTQIAFVSRGNILASKYPLKIAGVTYNLYVHSYLIYGQDEVGRWMRQQLFNRSSAIAQQNRVIDNPCVLRGYYDTYYPIYEKNVTFVGQGNPEECLKLINQMIYKPTESWRCNPKPCAIGNVYQPTIKAQVMFYVLGAFVNPLKRMKVLKADGSFSLRDLMTAAKKFCNTPVDELARQMNANGKSLNRECLAGLYTPILFEKGYGFSPDSHQLKIPDTPDGEIEWPVGALIYEFERERCMVGLAANF